MRVDDSGNKTECCDADALKGQYANMLRVGHNAFEFLLDLGQSYEKEQNEHFHSRIVTGPIYAKTFCETLQDAIHRYEKSFGVIQTDKEQYQE